MNEPTLKELMEYALDREVDISKEINPDGWSVYWTMRKMLEHLKEQEE